MRVAVNGLFLTRPHTGAGTYTRNLVRALAAAGHSLTVYVPERVRHDLPKKVRVRVVRPSRPWLGRGIALDRWETIDIAEAVAKSRADLYHTPYPTPPVSLRIPVVMTVHDMIPWELAQYRRGVRRRIKLGRILTGIRTANRLITVSQTAAEAIVRIALVPAERISVAYEDIDSKAKRPPQATIAAAQRRHHLERPYVLYLGGYDYRKNVRTLVDGFGKSGLDATHDLVLAGALTTPQTGLYADFTQLSRLVIQAGINQQVRTLGFLPEGDKTAILAGAGSFVYPSRAEGFGLPILEALAVGTPVAASEIPTTRELFTGAVTVFDPANATDLAKTLRQVTLRPNRAKITTGKKFAAGFRWSTVAAVTVRAYQKAISGTNL